MNTQRSQWRIGDDLLTAIQFLTRIPVSVPFSSDALARAAKFFPVVGLLVGTFAAGINLALAPHLPRVAIATLLVAFLVLITGCLHEDGLADTADALGGGHTRDQVLIILKDSRIGSYGATALALALIARVALLSSLSSGDVTRYLIASQVLCRWTTLPLSVWLPPARTATDGGPAGQSARIAKQITPAVLVFTTLFSFVLAAVLLRWHAVVPVTGAVALTFVSGLYYRRRTGGVTGDFFGATNQLTEIFVYLCGAWIA